MELNWSTFILEIINFLILVWILKRFFYKPVLNVIARRRAGIEKTLNNAKALHDDAEALREQYESRLDEWEKERQTAHVALSKEIEDERVRRLAALQTELEQEREKVRVIEQRKLETARLHVEETAIASSARFAARLLSAVSGPELEKRLVDLLLKNLSTLPQKTLDNMQAAAGNTHNEILVVSAYPLPEIERQALEQSLGKILGITAQFQYKQDKELLAGLRITIGAWVLRVNLQDELKSFANFAYEG